MNAFIQLATIIMCFCAIVFSMIMIVEQIKMPAKTGPAWAAKLILISVFVALITACGLIAGLFLS